MMRSRPLLFVLSLFSPALSAQGDPAQPDTKAGLVACITEILTALQGKPEQATPLIRALLLPEHERWFAQVFQPETAARGAKEYARLTADPERFEQEMRKMLDGLIKEQRTKVAAERIEPGEGGTGLQKSAFAAMLKPVPLYTVKMGKDSPSGYSIWSFVHVQGRFRLLGKMREALRDAETRPAQPSQGDAAQPDTTEGLVACITEILTALQGKPGQATPLIRALLLPEHERWFAQAFQPETAARGAKEYARLTADPERFEQEMRKMLDGLIKEQRTKVAAERIEPGEGGTGLQKSAFAAMLKPVPLYTVKMGKDSPSGYSIWSFVHVQGRFRLLGKMREALRDADKGPAGEPPAPDIKAFQAFAETLAAGKVEGSDLVLPDAEAWFAARFAAPLAATLAREYAAASAQLPRALPAGIQKTIGDGKTDVRVQTFHKAVDPEANGLVNAALQRMSVPTPLFVLRLVKPGESDGTTYWSFVHAGGAFRFVGKLAAIRPGGKATSGDLVADTLCALPLGAAEKVLQEKGLLTGSAVEYLRKEGTLR